MSARHAARLKVGPHAVPVSNPDKVLFPKSGIRKLELIEYYRRAAPHMLAHVRGRLISMERFPDGIEGQRFYQKEAPDYFSDFVRRFAVDSDDGSPKPYVVVDNEATIVYLANLVTVPHVWMSRVDNLRRPDRMVWDLDPMGLGFHEVKVAAKLLRYVLNELQLTAYPMLTGSRGLHLVAFVQPKHDVHDVFRFTKDVALLAARKLPQVFTATYTKSRRGKKIYVDTHRNVHAQTAVAPYAVRPLEEAPVAMPVTWDDVDDEALGAQSFTIFSAVARLDEAGDSWGTVERADDLRAAKGRLADLLKDSDTAGT